MSKLAIVRTNKTDIVRQAIAIFQELQKRRSQLQAEIDEIDRALGQVRNVSPVAAIKPAAQVGSNGTRVVRRGRPPTGSNGMPLREAVIRALAAGPKTKDELIAGVQQIGYKFATADPMNSLQTFLYGTGKKLVKRVEDKRFALVAGGAAAAKRPAPAKAKRNISPAARKRMADAARKMWADRKKAAQKSK